MKREHTISQSNHLLAFLQAHNCIFYSPLSYDDTTDWISGNSMVKYNTNSAVWDSGANMWKFQKVSSQPYGANQYYAKWDLKDTIVQTRMNLSILGEAYSTTTTNCVYDFNPTRIGLGLVSHTIDTGVITKSSQIFYTENNISHQKVYADGVIELDYNYNQPYNFFNGETGFRIGCPNNSARATTFCMRNFAVFAQPLSLSEINEYFSLI